MMRKAIVIAIAFATTLSGCALQRIKDTEARVDDAYGEHAASAASMRKTRDRAVEVIDRPWVSKTPITRPSAAAYPAPLQCPITFVPAAPISVFEFGQTVTALCGVPVRITPDAITALSGGARTAARTPDMTPPTGSGGRSPRRGRRPQRRLIAALDVRTRHNDLRHSLGRQAPTGAARCRDLTTGLELDFP